jgi:hypothetical protein
MGLLLGQRCVVRIHVPFVATLLGACVHFSSFLDIFLFLTGHFSKQ